MGQFLIFSGKLSKTRIIWNIIRVVSPGAHFYILFSIMCLFNDTNTLYGDAHDHAQIFYNACLATACVGFVMYKGLLIHVTKGLNYSALGE